MDLQQKDLSIMIETAVVAARLAGQRAMEESSYIKVSTKAGNELVTQADAICQKIIIDRIKETYPDHGFIAEEGTDNKLFKQPPRGSDDFWWIIDPIDGTNNFANKLPIFAVSVALFFQGSPVVGAIFEPATDSMFTAVKGQDARLNARTITQNSDSINVHANIGIESHFENQVPPWVNEFMLTARIRALGSAALQFAYLAKGSLIASIISKVKLWDIAAGALIAEQAGAVVTDWKGQKIFPLDPKDYNGQTISVLAANTKVQNEILNKISKS